LDAATTIVKAKVLEGAKSRDWTSDNVRRLAHAGVTLLADTEAPIPGTG
jgi:hypothetical protein